jgi:ketosteroid isomerase-like protein
MTSRALELDRGAQQEADAEFFGRFTAGDIAGVLDAMTDDATWWMAGKPGLAPVAGLKTKAEMATVLERLTGRLRTSLTVTVKSMIAESNKVAVELESYGELRNGRTYNNEYHSVVTIRGEKISAVREYLDTHHVFATFFAP